MQIPTKIQHGEKVISTVFEKINGIIDYLNASKLRKSSGIDVRETPSGTVLELVQKSASVPVQQNMNSSSSLIGFPNFFSNAEIVVNDTQTYTLSDNMWLIGRIEASNYSASTASYYKMLLQQDVSSTPVEKILFSIGDESTAIFRSTFVCLPLASGLILSFTKDYIGMVAYLTLYPCI